MVTILTSVLNVTIPSFQAPESLNDGRRRLPPPPATRRRLQQQFPLPPLWPEPRANPTQNRHRFDIPPLVWKRNRSPGHTWRPTWAPSQENGFRTCRSVRSEKSAPPCLSPLQCELSIKKRTERTQHADVPGCLPIQRLACTSTTRRACFGRRRCLFYNKSPEFSEGNTSPPLRTARGRLFFATARIAGWPRCGAGSCRCRQGRSATGGGDVLPGQKGFRLSGW